MCFRPFYRGMIQYRRCVASFVVDSGGPAAAAAAYREEGEGERGLASDDFLWRRKLSSPAAQAVWMNAWKITRFHPSVRSGLFAVNRSYCEPARPPPYDDVFKARITP